ncbi:hypothetical protein ABZW18_26205 [Streptomyces sp. NPDC004647]|uniref:hypothetical protein n=1 Tax=Streptomyces sp. NPDC004647 TaxID=3154671 RepID=UPI0033B47A16
MPTPPRFLVITNETGPTPIARSIEGYDRDRAWLLESRGRTVHLLTWPQMTAIRTMAHTPPLTFDQARQLARGVQLPAIPPHTCVHCDADLSQGESAYGDCVACGWFVCEACDAGHLPESGQSVCPSCTRHPDAAHAL